jgi:chromosome segregation ATPase
MPDGDQQANVGNVAGVTTPTPTPNASVNPQDTVEYWKSQYETMESRYKGASTKINEYDRSVKEWQQKFAASAAEVEGLKASSSNELTAIQTKAQTLEQQLAELSKKNGQYERKDKIRSLIHTEFADLATDFESDLIYQGGILSAAEQMDEAKLKESLTKSLELRKGQRIAAIEGAASGGTPTPPTSGNGGGGLTEAQIVEQLRTTAIDDPKRPSLMQKWQEARKRTQS